MLTYLIIILDDMSASFCHYDVARRERKLIALDDLRAGILFAMKENLNIQFVYPDYKLPEEYRNLIDSIDHTKIGPSGCEEELDMEVVSNIDFEADNARSYLWRCTGGELHAAQDKVVNVLTRVFRLNVILTDILSWGEKEFVSYQNILDRLSTGIVEHYRNGHSVQLNLLTDRFMIDKMNNCNAGDASITLAPDGRFYVCPAFYPDSSVGSLKDGIKIQNRQLYKLDHAPICRKCDAFQCKRCIWMNTLSTQDCNTPSHEQCVVAHLERRASCKLLQLAIDKGILLEGAYGIEDVEYLDPFNIINKWN